jgi:hypothetical protein
MLVRLLKKGWMGGLIAAILICGLLQGVIITTPVTGISTTMYLTKTAV